MTNILCYGDSNTFGHNPAAEDMRECRFPLGERWPGLLQTLLGEQYHVIEEGLGGRTTVFDDPSDPGRNGRDWLLPCIHTHQPLDLIVFMLGTNDTKPMFAAPVMEIARGMDTLVKIALNPFATNRGVPPRIFIVSPILLGEDIADSWLFGTFDHRSVEKSKGLAAAYRAIAEQRGCHFFDAATVAGPAPGEAVHIGAEGHKALAKALAGEIRGIFGSEQK